MADGRANRRHEYANQDLGRAGQKPETKPQADQRNRYVARERYSRGARVGAISDKLPDAKQLVVRKIQYAAGTSGGNFTLTGNAVNREAINLLVQNLNQLNGPETTPVPKALTPAKATPAKAPATPAAGKQLAAKKYRIVLSGSEDDRKNAKYPFTYLVRVFVDNPTPMQTTLGPPPDDKNPRFVPGVVRPLPVSQPKSTVAQPNVPATPAAPTTPVEAATAEVEL